MTFFIENSDLFIKLTLAIVLGLSIGTERLFAHKETGMKTHALVALGACIFVIISETLALQYGTEGSFDPSRIASQIIVGIGFLGAGSIMRQGSRPTGLTSAAGIWLTAGIGMAVGFGFYKLAILGTILVLLILVVFNMIERPLREKIHFTHNEKE